MKLEHARQPNLKAAMAGTQKNEGNGSNSLQIGSGTQDSLVASCNSPLRGATPSASRAKVASWLLS
jgi:hypothetical protein